MQIPKFGKSTPEPNFDREAIRKIKNAFGAPSISCGVLHQGKVIFTHSEGLANVESNLSADADTIYLIASCSKAFITATIAQLDHEKKLSWSDTVSSHLPDFKTPSDPLVGQRATLIDPCSHGTGLAPLDRTAGCFYDKMVNPGKYSTKISANLPAIYDFRSRFMYNNYMLGLAGDVVSKVTGTTAGQAVKKYIFDPLGMKRSGTSQGEYPDKNVAIGYSVFDDGSLYAQSDPQLADDNHSADPRDSRVTGAHSTCAAPDKEGHRGLQGASGFVRSSVNDMLTWAKAIMDSENSEKISAGSTSHTPGPLKGISLTRTARRPIDFRPHGLEDSYALGWFRHMLPSAMLGSIGPNFSLLSDNPPITGSSSPPRLAIAHWGEYGGFLTSFYTFPETQSAIIVMANCSPSRGDPTDLIAQSLFQTLFSMEPKVDHTIFAHRAAERAAAAWPAFVREFESVLERNKGNGGIHEPPATEFVGTYVNEGFLWTIKVYEIDDEEGNGEKLGLTINGLESQSVRLRHHHHDVWTCMPRDRDDAVRKGMEGFMALGMVCLSFRRGLGGRVCALEWDLQSGGWEGPAPGIERLVKPIVFEGEDVM